MSRYLSFSSILLRHHLQRRILTISILKSFFSDKEIYEIDQVVQDFEEEQEAEDNAGEMGGDEVRKPSTLLPIHIARKKYFRPKAQKVKDIK